MAAAFAAQGRRNCGGLNTSLRTSASAEGLACTVPVIDDIALYSLRCTARPTVVCGCGGPSVRAKGRATGAAHSQGRCWIEVTRNALPGKRTGVMPSPPHGDDEGARYARRPRPGYKALNCSHSTCQPHCCMLTSWPNDNCTSAHHARRHGRWLSVVLLALLLPLRGRLVQPPLFDIIQQLHHALLKLA